MTRTFLAVLTTVVLATSARAVDLHPLGLSDQETELALHAAKLRAHACESNGDAYAGLLKACRLDESLAPTGGAPIDDAEVRAALDCRVETLFAISRASVPRARSVLSGLRGILARCAAQGADADAAIRRAEELWPVANSSEGRFQNLMAAWVGEIRAGAFERALSAFPEPRRSLVRDALLAP